MRSWIGRQAIRVKVRDIVGLTHLRQNVETLPPPLVVELRAKRAVGQWQGLGLVVGTHGLQPSPEVSATAAHGILAMLFFPHFMDLYNNTIRAVLQVTLAQVVGGMWESVWMWALSSLYMRLSLLHWAMVKSNNSQSSPPWKLKAKIWGLMTAQLAICLWASSKWISILVMAATSDRQGSLLWRIKVPYPTEFFFNLGFALLPSLFVKLQGLRRQPTRRHRRHESSRVELPGVGREPWQS